MATAGGSGEQRSEKAISNLTGREPLFSSGSIISWNVNPRNAKRIPR